MPVNPSIKNKNVPERVALLAIIEAADRDEIERKGP
jgi:hypothetical protein